MDLPSSSDESNPSAAIVKVRGLVPETLLSPKVAIVCGSGLSTLVAALVDRIDVPYTKLPGFLTTQGKQEYSKIWMICLIVHSAWP